MDKRIELIEREPDIFVYLKPGYQMDGAHCFGEESLRDVKRTMRRVKPCQCAGCVDLQRQVSEMMAE